MSRQRVARAYWTVAPGVGEVRSEQLPTPGPGAVEVETRWSAVSRGTETLVHAHRVPASQRARMRAPFQVGDLPGPVKYGYLAVGEVVTGPPALLGRDVFCLHPHQDRFVVPARAVHPLPDGVPPRRGVLAGTLETAVNVLWDAAPRLGDRVAVVGAGMVGACVARLAAGVPGVRVDLVDPADRRDLARALGVTWSRPADLDDLVGSHDVVVHTSATADGLALALRLAPEDGEVIEASWFGDEPVPVPLGEDVHARRVAIRPTQVGAVAASRRSRRTTDERLATALDLLADPAYDALFTGESTLDELPGVMQVLAGGGGGLVHLVRYGA